MNNDGRESGQRGNMSGQYDEVGEPDIENVLKKTRRSFNLRIAKIITILAAVAWLAYMVPAVLGGVQSLHFAKASRALMDILQFSQPDEVNSWGNGTLDRASMTIPFTASVLPRIGKNFGEQKDFNCGMSVITGKITSPVNIGAQFIHPGLFGESLQLNRLQSPDAQSAILEKNRDTTVATVDFSLNGTVNLDYAANLLGKYDFDLCWLAVEAGIENAKPLNMTVENRQVLQWGIPGKLSKPGEFDFAGLKKDNTAEFEKAVMDEMKWLDANKNLISPSKSLLKNNRISNAVDKKAAYVLENGIRIYGLRVTGPSSELLKLRAELNPRLMTVIDMDFWNW